MIIHFAEALRDGLGDGQKGFCGWRVLEEAEHNGDPQEIPLRLLSNEGPWLLIKAFKTKLKVL